MKCISKLQSISLKLKKLIELNNFFWSLRSWLLKKEKNAPTVAIILWLRPKTILRTVAIEIHQFCTFLNVLGAIYIGGVYITKRLASISLTPVMLTFTEACGICSQSYRINWQNVSKGLFIPLLKIYENQQY